MPRVSTNQNSAPVSLRALPSSADLFWPVEPMKIPIVKTLGDSFHRGIKHFNGIGIQKRKECFFGAISSPYRADAYQARDNEYFYHQMIVSQLGETSKKASSSADGSNSSMSNSE